MLVLAPVLAGPSEVVAKASTTIDYPALGREVVALVRENFLDAERAKTWAERHAGYADGIRDDAVFAKRTNKVLAELKTSHTRYYPQSDSRYWGLAAIFGESLGLHSIDYDNVGLDVTDTHFVRSVLPGGPAGAAGLVRGDRILSADGDPFEPVRSFAGRAGVPVTLQVQRTAGGPTIAVTVVPRRLDAKTEWIEAMRASARVISRNGISVAYATVLWTVGEEFQGLIRDWLAMDFRKADALILDFRDGWGGCNPEFLNFLNRVPPVLTLVDRDGNRRTYDPQWRKPLFVLVNGGTRSGKEIVAHTLQHAKLATLVGTRTAGAVVGGRPYLLSNGGLLYLAVMGLEFDGGPLEGVGVAPDVVVGDRLEFAAGADPQLDRAIELAFKRASRP